MLKMTGTPPLFAKAPRSSGSAPTADILSDVLRAVRLTGAVYMSARFTTPFGIVSGMQYDPGMPMAHLRHISIFHLIASGGCTIELPNGECREIGAGDLILIPFAGRHKFSNGDAEETVFSPEHVQCGPIEGMWTVDYGGGGSEMRMVCGYIESSEFMFTPLFRFLPDFLIEHTREQKMGGLIAATVREIVSLVEAATPGSQLMLGRLMEMLFLEMLRLYAERLPEGSKGWLAALKDPIVARAIQLVHTEPARKWTAGDLAREAGTSRTVLADRFNAILGRPPIDYVTGWRIQLAADRLRNSREGIASIAANVGYESEAAFNRAFKREFGQPPGRYRGEHKSSPGRKAAERFEPRAAGS
jgi:AraC family transcriptional regulator, alkane utilization regulator